MKFDINGKTALHHAVENNVFQGCTRLLKTKDSKLINSQDNLGETALMMAIAKKDSVLINELFMSDELDLTLTNQKGQNLLHLLVVAKNMEHVERVLNKSCDDDPNHCLSTQADEQRKLPIHYCDDANLVKLLIKEHNNKCGNTQIDKTFHHLVTNEADFLKKPLFKMMQDNWDFEEKQKNLVWYATKYSRLEILTHIISNENCPGLKGTMELAVKDHKSDCLGRLMQSLHKNLKNHLELSLINTFIDESADVDFDIIKWLLKGYQWNYRKGQKMPNSTVEALLSYFTNNKQILVDNFYFVANFNERRLLKFALDNVSSAVKMEKGKVVLEQAMQKRLEENLLALLDEHEIHMDSKYFDWMTEKSFSRDIDIKIIK